MPNRIHQLPTEVANQIAAGEVIDRPAGAVKELLENALDAGARRILIEIEEGGKKLIRVRDDGSGMSARDARLCLQPHATSKIRDADDLWRVQTLGFRGEALPSLAAVSRLELTTREEDAEAGTQLVVEAGQVLDEREVGCAPGTDIVVRDLFFNTPARFKFLRSDAAEAARISEMVGHVALAYPSVSFVLQNNGRELLRVDGSGEGLSTLAAVFGREFAKQMLPIATSSKTVDITVTGFVGRPQLTRANRSSQLFFVNGRLVRSASLQHAFRMAYDGLLHGRERHPVGVVFLQVPPGAVDVNVHPNKSEVRFTDDGEVHRALRVAVRNTLVGAQLAPSFEVEAHQPEPPATAPVRAQRGTSPTTSASTTSASTGAASTGAASTASNSSKAPSLAVRDFAPELAGSGSRPQAPVPTAEERQRFAQHLRDVRSGVRREEETQPAPVAAPQPAPVPAPEPAPAPVPAPESESDVEVAPAPARLTAPQLETTHQPAAASVSGPRVEVAPAPQPAPQVEIEPEAALAPSVEPRPKLKLRPIAQITNNSYMVCEAEDGLYIVNQHRAHERILADDTIAAAQLKPVESQLLVIPFTLEVGARVLAAVEEHGHLLAQLGFEFEAFGGSALAVRAVPALVALGDYERAFGDLLDELVSGHAGSGLEERRNALLTMLACKNAIKAGDPLPPAAMQRLVDDLARVENPSICPHGQPILFKISSAELHRKFEREPAAKLR